MDHIQILKRVGLSLIVIGVIDIGFMVYCISHDMNYTSSFNIFAVIAGVSLYRGSLKTARTVTWFSAFMLTGLAGAMLVFIFLKPFDLWVLEFKLNPKITVISLVGGPAVIVFICWAYKNLRSRPVIDAQQAAGINVSRPRLPFVAGALLVLLLGSMMYLMTAGENGKKAKLLAREKYGDDYKYHVVNMNWHGGYGRASLAAYSQNEIKTVEVEWRE